MQFAVDSIVGMKIQHEVEFLALDGWMYYILRVKIQIASGEIQFIANIL